MELTTAQINEFTTDVWAYYAHGARNDLPWRLPEANGSFDPYKVMVSELMLQQTQVSRVIPKYVAFLTRYPTIHALATAELGDVLRTWQGLGYNRRAKFLWQAAQVVDSHPHFPNTAEGLVALPGVGKNTAGAILAYAYNQAVVFIETNIRTVYIHHFFRDKAEVADAEILQLVQQTLETEMPREFYWALMDYGSNLKATVGNLNHASKHFTKQSAFHGSKRQIRGYILRVLSVGPMSKQELVANTTDQRTIAILLELTAEGLIREENGLCRLG